MLLSARPFCGTRLPVAARAHSTRALRAAPTGRPQRRVVQQHSSRAARSRAAVVPVCSASASGASNGQSALGGALGALKNTQSIDRLRYQARYLFSQFDVDQDGVLNAEELSRFIQYTTAKAPAATAWSAKLNELNARLPAPGQNGSVTPACGFDTFVEVIRAQVAAAAEVPDYINSQLSREQLQKLAWDNGLSVKELASAHWVFSLLDFNSDGFISWKDLSAMPGLEGQIVEQKLGDEEDEGSPINYGKYLATYAKPRPVGLNVLCMVVHTACIWLVFNSPLTDILKLALTAFVVMQPRLVTKPVVTVYNIVTTLFGSFQAKTRIAREEGGFSNFSFQR